jgi:site-specific DNA-methyltransferase (adenine-specific)
MRSEAYNIEPSNIYCGDCLSIMPHIADKSVSCILCDLPFGTTKNKWDTIIPFEPLWEQYNRIIKDDGAIVLFSQQPFTSMLVMSNPKMFKYEWIWEKENGTGFLNSNHAPLKIHENILVFGKGATSPIKKSISMTYNPQKTKGKPYTAVQGYSGSNYSHTVGNVTISDGMRYPTDIIKFNRDKEKYHSTQKPVDLCRYLIRTYTNENDVVLDNTMGSGSTIVAAIKENRQYIGIEKDEHYFEIANKRIAAETSQLSLF